MSLKAEWDPAEFRLITKCEVLAAWKGLRLRSSGRKWRVLLADEPKAPPVAKGLGLRELEAWLTAPAPDRSALRARS